MEGNCHFCGRPVHYAPLGKGVVHVEPLSQMKVTPAEYARVMENAALNQSRDPQDRIHGLAIHQPTMEK